jgi:hypothetical protein
MTFDTPTDPCGWLPCTHSNRKQHSNVHNHPDHSPGTLRSADQASPQLSMHTAWIEHRRSGTFTVERAWDCAQPFTVAIEPVCFKRLFVTGRLVAARYRSVSNQVSRIRRGGGVAAQNIPARRSDQW